MSLKTQIDADIKQAMRDKDQQKLLALRDIKKAILIEETKPGAGGKISETEEMKILQRAVKQRQDSADIYKTQDRPDLLEKELAEMEIIKKYLPEQMSEEELEGVLKSIIEKVGASGPSDMGKVMGAATKQLAGKADGRTISATVKKLLG